MSYHPLKLLCLLLALWTLTLAPGCDNVSGPGGMSSGYPAKDHDPRLTEVAKDALPIIDALTRYHADHKAFPQDASDLNPYLPAKFAISKKTNESLPQRINGWYYFSDSTQYFLNARLGLDPVLQYKFKNDSGQWFFCPGDGSPDKPILLTP